MTDEPLQFCNSHWPPYSYGDTRGDAVGGYAVDFMNEIASRVERPVKLSILPWLRCLRMAELGEVDGIMLLTENEERKRFLHLSIPLLEDENLLWYPKESPYARERTDFEDLRGLRIGVVTGFNYGEPFNQAVKELDLMTDEASSVLSNLRRLDRNWIDVFPVNRTAAEYSLYGHPNLRARLVAVDGPFEPVGFRLGLAKAGRAPELIEQINVAIATMHEDGTITRILSQEPFEFR
ncbi:MAG: transporter substrate-binding domain-containing protein [Pseudomonadota bacterium]|nr:transporter substrate-binding domain-containing protein [Pseudomonadota bacterium]